MPEDAFMPKRCTIRARWIVPAALGSPGVTKSRGGDRNSLRRRKCSDLASTNRSTNSPMLKENALLRGIAQSILVSLLTLAFILTTLRMAKETS